MSQTGGGPRKFWWSVDWNELRTTALDGCEMPGQNVFNIVRWGDSAVPRPTGQTCGLLVWLLVLRAFCGCLLSGHCFFLNNQNHIADIWSTRTPGAFVMGNMGECTCQLCAKLFWSPCWNARYPLSFQQIIFVYRKVNLQLSTVAHKGLQQIVARRLSS